MLNCVTSHANSRKFNLRLVTQRSTVRRRTSRYSGAAAKYIASNFSLYTRRKYPRSFCEAVACFFRVGANCDIRLRGVSTRNAARQAAVFFLSPLLKIPG